MSPKDKESLKRTALQLSLLFKMIAIFSEVGMESYIVRTINHDLVMIVDKMSLV